MRVVVIGSGVAGLSCARSLADGGVEVRVVSGDTAPGGRLGSAVWDGRPVDLGAAYLTASSPPFAAQVAAWHEAGLLHPWRGDFTVYGSRRPAASPAPVRWAASGGLGSLGTAMADGLDVTYGVTVADLTQFADAVVVLAMPLPSAARILPAARAVAPQDWQPSLAVALRYERRSWKPMTGTFVNDHPVLTTVCDDGSRRGDGAAVLVAHTTPAHANESAADDVEVAVRELFDLPAAESILAHRWPHARPLTPSSSLFAQVNGVFLAGDAYGRPRVETAWVSGREVAAAILRGEVGKTPRTASRPR